MTESLGSPDDAAFLRKADRIARFGFLPQFGGKVLRGRIQRCHKGLRYMDDLWEATVGDRRFRIEIEEGRFVVSDLEEGGKELVIGRTQTGWWTAAFFGETWTLEIVLEGSTASFARKRWGKLHRLTIGECSYPYFEIFEDSRQTMIATSREFFLTATSITAGGAESIDFELYPPKDLLVGLSCCFIGFLRKGSFR